MKGFPSRAEVERLRQQYPKGTRASGRIKTSYREDVLSSLPENNTTENITELKRFWRMIREENNHE